MKTVSVTEGNLLEVFRQMKSMFFGKNYVTFFRVYVPGYKEARIVIADNPRPVAVINGDNVLLSQKDVQDIYSRGLRCDVSEKKDNIVFHDIRGNEHCVGVGDLVFFDGDGIYHQKNIDDEKNPPSFVEAWILS